MLRPIKTFYIDKGIPTYEDWKQAVEIAQVDECVVEVRWLPNIYAGWYHDYVFMNSDPTELDARTPRVYGV